VRLWDQDALIGQLLEHYERLDEDLRAELPLKRVWMMAAQDEEDEA
jgi:restriction system protein